jgi:hypothetical protein
MNTFLKVLPRQAHYYMLSDGSRYARHGKAEANGLLVFAILERAEQFMMTIGAALPEFKPVKHTAEEVLAVVVANGGRLCVTDNRLAATVATIVNAPQTAFGMEGANRMNTNWSRPPKRGG